jgi:hypothetical protein
VLSVSYYSQQMFAHHRGTETLPVTAVQGSFNPLWWVATIDDVKNEMYFKVVNSGNSSIPLTINLDLSYSAVNGTILVGVRPDDHSEGYSFQSNPKQLANASCPDFCAFDRLQLPRQPDRGHSCSDWQFAGCFWQRTEVCVECACLFNQCNSVRPCGSR